MSATPLAMPKRRPAHGFYIAPSTIPTQPNTKAGKPRKARKTATMRTRTRTRAVATAAA